MRLYREAVSEGTPDCGSAVVRVGAVDIQPVYDGCGTEPAREILTCPGHAGDPWVCHEHLLDPDGRLKLTVGGFLVRTVGRMNAG